MRRHLLVLAGLVLLGLLGLLALAQADDRPDAQTLGVHAVGPVAHLDRGDEVCQEPVTIAERVETLRFNPNTTTGPGPAIAVTIRSVEDDRTLSSGRLAAGFDPAIPQDVHFPPVPAESRVRICFRNEGPGTARLFGDMNAGSFAARAEPTFQGVRPTVQPSSAELNGRRQLRGDLAIVFKHKEQTDLASHLPQVIERAARFKAEWVSKWVLLGLLALLVGAAPLLLAHAVSTSVGSPGQSDADAAE